MKKISAKELYEKIKNNDDIVLIDVREDFEREEFHIGGVHIPFNDIFTDLSLIRRDVSVVFYCKKGVRSLIAIQRLEEKYGFDNLVNLSGGTEEWKKMMNGYESEN